MNTLTRFYVRLRESHKGQAMVEYSLILAVIAVVALVGYEAIGSKALLTAQAVAAEL